ncbi:hypothetical protein CB0940_02042 [Cercospora beticola]|uniref:Uncharacterized protein n=1 Tax=Cercospora beticola TaxID=122368 RepID=A0A2G5ID87_CERBT|nr:hypothetical protein CB0940_02042 [Cercospora beticola]PIB02642.1 hypothetical protein CB0940_02042 [Cercospora beticola]
MFATKSLAMSRVLGHGGVTPMLNRYAFRRKADDDAFALDSLVKYRAVGKYEGSCGRPLSTGEVKRAASCSGRAVQAGTLPSFLPRTDSINLDHMRKSTTRPRQQRASCRHERLHCRRSTRPVYDNRRSQIHRSRPELLSMQREASRG